jgi:hypothetical protein
MSFLVSRVAPSAAVVADSAYEMGFCRDCFPAARNPSGRNALMAITPIERWLTSFDAILRWRI